MSRQASGKIVPQVYHRLVLRHLAEKYTTPVGGALYEAFVYFKSAFVLIPRQRLWDKLEETNLGSPLLTLIRCLYENTRLQVRCNSKGHLSCSTLLSTEGNRDASLPLLSSVFI